MDGDRLLIRSGTNNRVVVVGSLPRLRLKAENTIIIKNMLVRVSRLLSLGPLGSIVSYNITTDTEQKCY